MDDYDKQLYPVGWHLPGASPPWRGSFFAGVPLAPPEPGSGLSPRLAALAGKPAGGPSGPAPSPLLPAADPQPPSGAEECAGWLLNVSGPTTASRPPARPTGRPVSSARSRSWTSASPATGSSRPSRT